MPIWPHKVANFSCFNEDRDLIGIADIVLPTLTNLTDSWKGAGLAGETDVPIQAHFGPIQVTLNWHLPIEDTMILAVQDGLTLDCWAAFQFHDSGVNKLLHKGWRFFMSTLPKETVFGNLEVGVAGAAATTLELFALQASFDDRELVHIDKEAMICTIRGVDYAARIRQLIGRST